jgi:hypothetical protein
MKWARSANTEGYKFNSPSYSTLKKQMDHTLPNTINGGALKSKVFLPRAGKPDFLILENQFKGFNEIPDFWIEILVFRYIHWRDESIGHEVFPTQSIMLQLISDCNFQSFPIFIPKPDSSRFSFSS